jgi:hypothetical protein
MAKRMWKQCLYFEEDLRSAIVSNSWLVNFDHNNLWPHREDYVREREESKKMIVETVDDGAALRVL